MLAREAGRQGCLLPVGRETASERKKAKVRVGRGRPIGGKTTGIQREGEPATAVLLVDSREMGGLCFLYPLFL